MMADETSRSVKSRILDAAILLLRKAGAKRLAQPQVAREAGVPQGHLTYYFPRKIDLLIGVATQVTAMMQQELESVDPASVPGSSVADALTELVFNHERSRSMLGLIAEADLELEVADTVQKAHRFVQLAVARLIEMHPDSHEVALTTALVLGLGQQQLLYKNRPRADVHAMIELWLRATLPAPHAKTSVDELRRSGTVVRSPDDGSAGRVVSGKK
jgi:AcrR family transcriptional regulator